MAGKTIGFGIALIILGLVGYLGTGTSSVTALIPAFFGAPLVILGWLAKDASKRKVVMHIAVVVALLGFVGALYSVIARSGSAHWTATAAQAVMVVLTGVYVGLCVKSFIDARRPQS